MNETGISKTGEQIEHCFMQLVRERKSVRLHVTELCEYAGISRKTFYNHFADLGDVLESIYRQTVDSVLLECFDRHYSTEEFLLHIYRTFQADKEFFIPALRENTQNSFTEIMISHCRRAFNSIFCDYITDEDELDYLSYKYAALNALLVQKWGREGMQQTPEFMTRVYLRSHADFEDHHNEILGNEHNW